MTADSHGVVALQKAIEKTQIEINGCEHELRMCDERIKAEERDKKTIRLNLRNRQQELSEMKADLAKLRGRHDR